MDLAGLWRVDLTVGRSKHPASGACVLDAVSWFEYGRLGDRPSCVSPIIAAYVRVLNDYLPAYNRQRLKAYIPRLAGSVDRANEAVRADFLAWQAIKVFAPIGLRRFQMHRQANALAEADSLGAAAIACSEAHRVLHCLGEGADRAARRAKPPEGNLGGTELSIVDDYFIRCRFQKLRDAMGKALGHAANAATAKRRQTRAAEAMMAAAALVDTDPTLMIRTPIIDAAFAALDGALALGRQSHDIDLQKLQNAVELFARAREAVSA